MKPKGSILVIDDDELTVKVIRRLLEDEGFGVLVAPNGLSGLDQARQAKPDVITLDINMPGIDGYEVCRRLQADPATSDIPVLILTGLGHPERNGHQNEISRRIYERIEGYDAGAVEFLSKPLRKEEFLRRVNGLLWLVGLGA